MPLPNSRKTEAIGDKFDNSVTKLWDMLREIEVDRADLLKEKMDMYQLLLYEYLKGHDEDLLERFMEEYNIRNQDMERL